MREDNRTERWLFPWATGILLTVLQYLSVAYPTPSRAPIFVEAVKYDVNRDGREDFVLFGKGSNEEYKVMFSRGEGYSSAVTFKPEDGDIENIRDAFRNRR